MFQREFGEDVVERNHELNRKDLVHIVGAVFVLFRGTPAIGSLFAFFLVRIKRRFNIRSSSSQVDDWSRQATNLLKWVFLSNNLPGSSMTCLVPLASSVRGHYCHAPPRQ